MGISKKYTDDEFIQTDRESFRRAASEALRRFTPEDREAAASLESEHVVTADVLRVWFEQLEPLFRDLEAKRTDTKLRNSLKRHLGYADHQAEAAIDVMVDEREQQLLDEVISNLYHTDLEATEYQRGYAEEFLIQPPETIAAFSDRYSDFIEAVDASEKHQVALLDAHGSWLERQRAASAISKERQKLIEDEDNRLAEIDAQLSRLTAKENDLTAYVIKHDWDYSTVLDLFQKYHKKVEALKESDHKNPTKRLKLFESVTSKFRDHEAGRLAHERSAHSLKQMKAVSEEVYSRLLEIFDLPARERSRLSSDIERYSRLSQERDVIQVIQQNRRRFTD